MATTNLDYRNPTILQVDDSQVTIENGVVTVDLTAGAEGELLAANNLSDVASAATSRTNLGGTATGVAVFTAASAAAAATAIGATVTGAAVLTAASAAAAQTAIGATVTGAALFTAATASAARTTLGITNLVPAYIHVADITGAGGVPYVVVAPVSGTIVSADLVVDASPSMGPVVATLAIGAVAVTSGVMTVADGAPAFTVGASNPSAANVVVGRTSVINAAISGGNLAAGTGTITILIQPS
jgi:hypothetical protein